MKKMIRVLPLVALVALVTAIPASTQVVAEDEASSETVNLPMLIAVNRMELTRDQMEQIHAILQGLLEGRETREDAFATLQDEMIAFQGTADELDAILEAHRTEALETAEAQREAFAEAIDQIKEILTLKQGETLYGALGGLLGGQSVTGVGMRGRAMMPGFGRTSEPQADVDVLRERIEGRFGERAGEMMEDLAERMADIPEVAERLGRLRTEMTDRPAQASGCVGIRGMGGISVRRGVMPGAVGGQLLSGARRGGGIDLIEQLVQVLELKLQALE